MPFLAALGDLLKKQPKVPKFTPIDPGAEQLKAISSNAGAISELKRLAGEVNNLSIDEFKSRMGQLIPQFESTLANVSGNIDTLTRGEIPEDVASAVERRSASRAYAGGYGGSERAGFLRTRDLGLTSLDLTQRGFDAASRWLTTVNNAVPQFDVTSMFITPQQQIQNTWMNTQAQMNNQWMKNQQAAERNPGTIFGNALNQADSFIQGIAGAAVGGFGVGLGGGGIGAMGAQSGAPPSYLNTQNAVQWPPGYTGPSYGYGG